jgi:hypothetical protein
MRKRHLNGSPVWSDSIHKTQDCSINYPDFTDTLTELRTGSRRDRLPEIRAGIVRGLTENYGTPIADVARQVGISTSGRPPNLTTVDR